MLFCGSHPFPAALPSPFDGIHVFPANQRFVAAALRGRLAPLACRLQQQHTTSSRSGWSRLRKGSYGEPGSGFRDSDDPEKETGQAARVADGVENLGAVALLAVAGDVMFHRKHRRQTSEGMGQRSAVPPARRASAPHLCRCSNFMRENRGSGVVRGECPGPVRA